MGTITKNNPEAECVLERAQAHSQEMENNLQLQQKNLRSQDADSAGKTMTHHRGAKLCHLPGDVPQPG